MRSSYFENDIGLILRNYVVAFKPCKLVELGLLDGYSTLWIAKGLKRLHELGGYNLVLDAYDLFEEYPYKHGTKENIEKMLKENEVDKYVNVIKGDAYKVYEKYNNPSLEFLHIDLSNTGDIVKDIIELWHPKIHKKGIIMIEGGSDERDNIEWMKSNNYPSIKKEIETNQIINEYYYYGTYYRFPSITMLIRKWWM
jgi:predicted O-methyltransferase YrrM